MPTWNTYTMGNADLAFLSAGQYLELSTTEDIIPVVSADELSPLDLTAGSVRFVSPDEVNEIDLAHEPAVFIASSSRRTDRRRVRFRKPRQRPRKTKTPKRMTACSTAS